MAQLGWTVYFPSRNGLEALAAYRQCNITGSRELRAVQLAVPWRAAILMGEGCETMENFKGTKTLPRPPKSATHPTAKEILSRLYLGEPLRDHGGFFIIPSWGRVIFPGRENMSCLGVPCSFPCCNKTYIGSFGMNKRHFGEFVWWFFTMKKSAMWF